MPPVPRPFVGIPLYTLNVIITDFTGDQNLLMAAVMYWLRTNQPDALQNLTERDQLCTFEVDVLGNARVTSASI